MSLLNRIIYSTTQTLLPHTFITKIRLSRQWKNRIRSLSPQLLVDMKGATRNEKKDLFKKHVRMVEIETHARCNRLCTFCPNADGNRSQNPSVTAPDILDRVFTALGEIDYHGQIKVARYSEPLANLESLYNTLKSARSKVPNSEIAIVTNTDYLNSEILDTLETLGLDIMYMSIYLPHQHAWSAEKAHTHNMKLASKLGLRVVDKFVSNKYVHYTFRYKTLVLRSFCTDFGESGNDRGGLLDRFSSQYRIAPCWEPFETFIIDYTGMVVPCCNVLSDFPEHNKFVLASLADKEVNIFDVYASQLSHWRQSMVGFGKKPPPCTTCKHNEAPEHIHRQLKKILDKRLEQFSTIKM